MVYTIFKLYNGISGHRADREDLSGDKFECTTKVICRENQVYFNGIMAGN